MILVVANRQATTYANFTFDSMSRWFDCHLMLEIKVLNWLLCAQGKKDKPNAVVDSSRRAVSFRFPAKSSAVAASVSADDDLKGKNSKFDTRSTISEMDIGKWEIGGGSEFDFDEENQSCYSMDSSQARAPSFARRTLL